MSHAAPAPDILFFDGGCAFCDGAVRRVLERDARGRFAAAPLGGATYRAAFEGLEPPPRGTLVVRDAGGTVHLRSAAVLRVLRGLGGAPAILAALGSLVPRRLADALYDAFAARRRAVPAPPAGACPRPPEAWRGRLLP